MGNKRRNIVILVLVFVFSLLFFDAGGVLAQDVDSVRVIPLSARGYERGHALAFSSDGKQLAVGGISGVYLFDFQTLSAIDFIQTNAWARSITFLPGTSTLAVGLFDQTIKFWNTHNTNLLQTLDGPQGWVRSISVSGDGSLIASASDDNTLRVWDLMEGTSILVLDENTMGIRTVALSPDGRLVAGAPGDNTVRVWSVPDGRLLHTLVGHEDWVRSLAFSPDGGMLASGSFDKTVRLWDLTDNRKVHTMEGHTSSVLSVAFSPDGSTIASGSVDQTVRLWQVATGDVTRVLEGHDDFVYAVTFSPDGQSLASGGGDNTARVWNLDALNSAEPPMATTTQSVSSDCRACHHQSQTEPARVIELGCEGCHAGGAGLSWCAAVPRAGAFEPTPASYKNVPEPSGVPLGSREIAVVIISPGNGETLYVNGEYLVPEKIKGKVYYAGQESITRVKVELEIISGDKRIASLITYPSGSGEFSFGVEINSDDPPAHSSPPPDRPFCHSCHVRLGTRTDLPKGDIRLVVTATAPDGGHASDERWLHVDSSDEISVPVRVIDSTTGEPISDLSVEATTILYEWRARTAGATADGDGKVQLNLESLSQSSTIYDINVPSQIINGILYTSDETVQLELKPGRISYPTITLSARGQAGNLTGDLGGDKLSTTLEGTNVWAVQLPAGPVYQALLSSDGTFAFEEIPIAEYLVFADAFRLAKGSLNASSQKVDLLSSPQTAISLALRESRIVSGKVTSQDGTVMPFAWVTAGENMAATQINPLSGEYLLFDLPASATYLTVSAPGYYSLSQDVDLATESIDFQLAPKAETQRLPWGEGEVILPSESIATVINLNIELEHGWLWGRGGAQQTLRIGLTDMDVSVLHGQFALESPAGETAWFYLYDGEAKVTYVGNEIPIVIHGGEMIALVNGSKPISLEESLVGGLHSNPAETPVAEGIEPSIRARLADRLVKAGINAAQLFTLITYSFSLAAVIGIPCFALFRARKRAETVRLK